MNAFLRLKGFAFFFFLIIKYLWYSIIHTTTIHKFKYKWGKMYIYELNIAYLRLNSVCICTYNDVYIF